MTSKARKKTLKLEKQVKREKFWHMTMALLWCVCWALTIFSVKGHEYRMAQSWLRNDGWSRVLFLLRGCRREVMGGYGN